MNRQSRPTLAERREKLRLLTIKELAELTGISERTIREGGAGVRDLPIIRLGQEIRFRLSDVEDWIASNTHEPVRVWLRTAG